MLHTNSCPEQHKVKFNNANKLIKTTFKKISKINTFDCPSKTNKKRKVNCT